MATVPTDIRSVPMGSHIICTQRRTRGYAARSSPCELPHAGMRTECGDHSRVEEELRNWLSKEGESYAR